MEKEYDEGGQNNYQQPAYLPSAHDYNPTEFPVAYEARVPTNMYLANSFPTLIPVENPEMVYCYPVKYDPFYSYPPPPNYGYHPQAFQEASFPEHPYRVFNDTLSWTAAKFI